jgi:hypothetical protein
MLGEPTLPHICTMKGYPWEQNSFEPGNVPERFNAEDDIHRSYGVGIDYCSGHGEISR